MLASPVYLQVKLANSLSIKSMGCNWKIWLVLRTSRFHTKNHQVEVIWLALPNSVFWIILRNLCSGDYIVPRSKPRRIFYMKVVSTKLTDEGLNRQYISELIWRMRAVWKSQCSNLIQGLSKCQSYQNWSEHMAADIFDACRCCKS